MAVVWQHGNEKKNFIVLKRTFNVGRLRTQHTTCFDKLTTFILEGAVSGVMVALKVLCGLKIFFSSRIKKQ